jgi:prevent-host-death family protein
MRAAGVAELKAKLSSYLERVKGGAEIVVTEHGVPVAKLVPLAVAERQSSRRKRLAASGTLKLGRGKVRRLLLSPPHGDLRGEAVLAELLAEREEGQ